MSINAANPQELAEQLLRITRRLDELIRAETKALDQTELDASSQQWAEKEKLARAYRLEMVAIRQDPARLSGISPKIQQALKNAITDFQHSLSAHAEALNAIKGLTEGLVRSISEAIASERAPPALYGAKGQTRHKHNAQGIAINAKA